MTNKLDTGDDITKLAKRALELDEFFVEPKYMCGAKELIECREILPQLATAYLELKEKYEQLLSLSGEALNQLENGDYIYRCSGCTPYEQGNADCPGHSALETLKEDLHKFLERKEPK